MTDNIRVNTQSSIKICAEKIVYADPLQIGAAENDADIILITHSHFDHFSADDIAKVRKADTVFVMPESMRAEAEQLGISKDKFVSMRPGDKTEAPGIPVEAVYAYNPAKPFHPKANGWLGYVVTLGGKRIYIAGDTDDTPEAAEVKCDIALVPVGGKFTMDYRQAAELVNRIAPETAVPIHYGGMVGSPSDGDSFARLVDDTINVVFKL